MTQKVKIHEKLKELRIGRNRTQEQMAIILGVSRPTYAAIETGKQEMSVGQLEKVTKFFSIDVKSLLSGASPDVEKYKQMMLYFLREVKAKDKKIPKTKLAKLLYLADFAWFYDTFTSMSGMEYRRITYGPVPDTYFAMVDEMLEAGRIDVSAKEYERGRTTFLISENESNKNQRLNLISTGEKALMKKIISKWEKKSTQEIVNFTHNQLPYFLCNDKEIIPYELIVQEDPDKVI